MQRRRFQTGSVYLNKTKTLWKGAYAEYYVDEHGVEMRHRREVTLCPLRKPDGSKTTKHQAQRLLQPFIDKVNTATSTTGAREQKTATFHAFSEIWERDYLSLSKPATQSAARSNLKRLRAAPFATKCLRHIDAGDVQRFVAESASAGLSPKTVRNLWGSISQILHAAHAQRYVDAVLPKPKLPRKPKVRAKCFTLPDVGKIIAESSGEDVCFYWLAAEAGLRAGELAGLQLTDFDGVKMSVSRSIWDGDEQSPKTDNSVRVLALSPQLTDLIWQQTARQKQKGHIYLFTSSVGTPRDMNCFRSRKMRGFLRKIEVNHGGFHAFRHFSSSLMDALRVPLKTIQERMGHALTGNFTLDVYGGQPEWERNVEAAALIGAEIERSVALQRESKIVMNDSLFTVAGVPKEEGSGAEIS